MGWSRELHVQHRQTLSNRPTGSPNRPRRPYAILCSPQILSQRPLGLLEHSHYLWRPGSSVPRHPQRPSHVLLHRHFHSILPKNLPTELVRQVQLHSFSRHGWRHQRYQFPAHLCGLWWRWQEHPIPSILG